MFDTICFTHIYVIPEVAMSGHNAGRLSIQNTLFFIKASPDGPAGSSSSFPTSKAIGSLAKKQADITRQGTQKLKFVPTLPARRKKEYVSLLLSFLSLVVLISTREVNAVRFFYRLRFGIRIDVYKTPTTSARSSAVAERGRGRGRGEGSGRGRGRGTSRPESEMTASGPFAMGPALAGNNARRSVPRSNFAPIVSPPKSGSLPAVNFTHAAASPIKQEGDPEAKGKDKRMVGAMGDDEVYSDPDEGVEIVDMENVRQMDWMAPESLRKERHIRKIKKEDSPGRSTLTHLWCCSLSIFRRSHR
jgi:DNA-directed RNA polymerase III subunit RPC4